MKDVTNMKRSGDSLDIESLFVDFENLPPDHGDFIADTFRRGRVSILASDAGEGKSTLSQKLAYDLSTGGDIWDGFTVSKPKSVLLVCVETSAGEIKDRERKSGWQYNPEKLFVMDYRSLDRQGHELTLRTQKGRDLLAKAVASKQLDLVIIDSLSFVVDNESDREKMAEVMRFLDKLADNCNIAILVIHHYRKSKKAEISLATTQNELSGSSIINRMVSLILGITHHKSPDGEPLLLVEGLKTRDHPFPRFAFSIEGDSDHLSVSFDHSPIVGSDSKSDIVWQRILMAYGTGQTFQRSNVEGVCPEVSPAYLKKLLKKWTFEGRLLRVGEGRSTEYRIKTRQRGDEYPIDI